MNTTIKKVGDKIGIIRSGFKSEVASKTRDTIITYSIGEIDDDRIEFFENEINENPFQVVDDLLNIIEYLETELDKANTVNEMIEQYKPRTTFGYDLVENGLYISKNSLYECAFNGLKLTSLQMSEIRDFYEASCYAETIRDKYDIESAKSIELGYKVRERMSDDNATKEDDIIKEIVEATLKEQMEKDVQDICNKTLQLHSDYGDEAIEKLKKMLKLLM